MWQQIANGPGTKRKPKLIPYNVIKIIIKIRPRKARIIWAKKIMLY